jgi:hypothetical protein
VNLMRRPRAKWLTGVIVSIALALALFPPAGAAAPPEILSQSATGITETSVVLEATIDPVEGAAYYQFQIVPAGTPLPSEILCPDPSAGAPPCEGTQTQGALPISKVDGEAQSVAFDYAQWATAKGYPLLQPVTTYVYRVVAARALETGDGSIEWEEPTVIGVAKSFTTAGGIEPMPHLEMPEPPEGITGGPLGCRRAGNPCCRLKGPRRCCRRAVRHGKVRCLRPRHVSHFSLLHHRVGLPHLPYALRFGLSQWLSEGTPRNLRGGTVHLPEEVVIYGVGSPEVACMSLKSGGWPLGGGGVRRPLSNCASMADARRKGVSIVSSSSCPSRRFRISGLVPNGITNVGIGRYDTGEIEEVVPVKSNAFTLLLQSPVGVVLHGIGPKSGGFKMKFPLRELTPKVGPRCLK